MKIINRIKLYTQYYELHKLNIDSKVLEKAISDKHFSEIYKKEIRPFIQYLYNYHTGFGNNSGKKLDIKIISNHIKSIIKMYNGTSCIKYIEFIKNNHFEIDNFNNVQIINDANFEILFNLIGTNIFEDNIFEIINNGFSEKLKQLIKKRPKIDLKTININLFDEKVWNIINSNPKIGETTTLDLFEDIDDSFDLLIKIINLGLFEGFKYTYENIPESHYFIKNITKRTSSVEQFDINFIKRIGNATIAKMYSKGCFTNEDEYSKIFKIYQNGNYELIQDIINYDTDDFSFKNILDEDISKKLLSTNIGKYDKKEVLLNKYFGIEKGDNKYIKLFLSAISKIQLDEEFTEKYWAILTLLNMIYNANEEEIILLSEKLNSENKEKYKQLIYECEKEGNELIRRRFSEDLIQRNNLLLNHVPHNVLATNSGKSIEVYELTGQPFTMLVHAITDNKLSKNNSYVSQIISNPNEWNNITGGNVNLSTSLISDRYMCTYGVPNKETTVMYGFCNIPSESIKMTLDFDTGIKRDIEENYDYNIRNIPYKSINIVVSIDELIQKTVDSNKRNGIGRWNEVILNRTNEKTGKRLQPDYIVCMDFISENSKKAAEFFGIPIYLIHTKYYNKNSYNIEEENSDIEKYR